MADWENIEKTTASPEVTGDELTVFIDVKLIGNKPMYRARIDANNSVVIVKYPLENSSSYYQGYNAQFTYKNRRYLLNVPYWN